MEAVSNLKSTTDCLTSGEPCPNAVELSFVKSVHVASPFRPTLVTDHGAADTALSSLSHLVVNPPSQHPTNVPTD